MVCADGFQRRGVRTVAHDGPRRPPRLTWPTARPELRRAISADGRRENAAVIGAEGAVPDRRVMRVDHLAQGGGHARADVVVLQAPVEVGGQQEALQVGVPRHSRRALVLRRDDGEVTHRSDVDDAGGLVGARGRQPVPVDAVPRHAQDTRGVARPAPPDKQADRQQWRQEAMETMSRSSAVTLVAAVASVCACVPLLFLLLLLLPPCCSQGRDDLASGGVPQAHARVLAASGDEGLVGVPRHARDSGACTARVEFRAGGRAIGKCPAFEQGRQGQYRIMTITHRGRHTLAPLPRCRRRRWRCRRHPCCRRRRPSPVPQTATA